MLESELPLALTYEDVLLVPRHSSVLPNQVDVSTRLTSRYSLSIPFISAAMDTVTEANGAIAMAFHGGAGVIHKNFSVAAQAEEVRKVKKAVTGVVTEPITIGPEATLGQARRLMNEHNISGVPVLKGNRVVGILTNRDLRFEKALERSVHEVMSTDLVTTAPGTNLEQAKVLMQEHKIEKLLVVDAEETFCGLITIKDIETVARYPNAVLDDRGHLLCAAAVGVGADGVERAAALVEAGVNLLVVDTAHGHSEGVLQACRKIRQRYSDIALVIGNVATADATRACIDAGANIVKVGIGPGSICTTRIVAGVGVPQLTAVAECAKVAHEHGATIIADGGIKYSGDAAKAIAAGADAVMIGSLLAGTDESPGEVLLYQGRRYKSYRGMGSIEAMRAGSSDRYFQEDVGEFDAGSKKLVPEGIVGRVPYKGPMGDVVYQLVGGLRSSMGYCGCPDIQSMQQDARFVQITSAGLRESHVHDVIVTREAPNYRLN